MDAAERLVISVTQIHTGSVDNVIPDTAYINGTVRSFTPEIRELAERRLREIVAGQAASYGCEAEVVYNRGYPATYNSAEGVVTATKAVRDVSSVEAVVDDFEPVMGSEDFSYILEKVPVRICSWGRVQVPVFTTLNTTLTMMWHRLVHHFLRDLSKQRNL